ncbi:MAG: hypothetical protein M1839_007666 [Geoglossum umbratile]|nr:MAG: hypothetical protein M1839_007666 [Geoglossum umbratile]
MGSTEWPAPAPSDEVLDLVLAVLGSGNRRSSGNGGSTLQRWSSLVGIVTAISGNILISFALNIQRYAHIRLQRERARNAKRAQVGKRLTSGGSGYGAINDTGNGDKVNGSSEADTGKQASRISTDNDAHNVDEDSDGSTSEREPLTQSFTSAHSYNSSSTMREKSDSDPSNTYLRSPYWWAGIILMTIGEAGNFLAYGFASASIVSPLGVVALISNCVIAPLMLKEPFRVRDFWGVVVAVAGAVVVVLSAKQSETKLGPHEIWGAIARWEFETYLGITIFLILLGVWLSGKYGDRTILIDLGLVALFGGYTALSTKGVASLLSYKFFHILTFPVTYLLVTVLISSALLQIVYLNRALQRFDSTQVIPTQFVLFTLSVIIGSSVLYRDFQKATLDRVTKFVAGCMLTFTGVYLITSNRPRNRDSDEEFEADEEGAFGLIGDEEGYADNIDVSPKGDVWAKRMSTHGVVRNGNTTNEGVDGEEPEGTPTRRGSLRVSDGGDSVYSFPQRPSSLRSSVPSRASSLLANPWQDEEQPPATPSRPRLRLHASSSESAIASGTQTPRDQELPELNLARSSSQPHPTERPTTPAPRHRALSFMMPGPLSSPLSSLTAVVADELRRGIDSASSPIHKRFGSLRASGPSSNKVSRLTRSARKAKATRVVVDGSEDMEPSGSPLMPSPVIAEGPEPANTGKGRRRGLSATLGDFARRKKAKSGPTESGD